MKRNFIVVLFLAIVLLVSCNRKELVDKQQLTSQEWVLSEFKNGDTLCQLPSEKLIILFTDTNTVYGTAGCNRFMGSYELSEKKGLMINPGGMTMMACPDLEFENIYMKALSNTTFASISNHQLIIEGNDGEVVLMYDPYVMALGEKSKTRDCDAAAGYVWSEVKGDCIRIFETGIRMKSKTDNSDTSFAFLVFSSDSLQAELFLPGEDIQEVLVRRLLPEGGYVWSQEDDDTYTVTKKGGSWAIYRRGIVLYTSDTE